MTTSPDPAKKTKGPSRYRRWRNSVDGSSSKRRLERDLAKAMIEIGSLEEKDARREADSEWAKNSRQLLALAEESRISGNIDQAWVSLKAANRWSLYGLFYQDKTLFDALSLSVYREGTAKKIDSVWRRNTIKDLLSADGKEFTPITKPEDIGKAFWAQTVLDDYQNNIYEKSYILKRRLLFLNIAAFITISGWILLAPKLKEMKTVIDHMPVRTFWLAVVLVGVIGAITSGFTRSLGQGGKARIPDQIAETSISYARLFVGGVSAIGITIFLLSGLINLGNVLSLGLILALAFISGFTEKLLQNAIDKTVSSSQKPEDGTQEQTEKYETQSIEPK